MGVKDNVERAAFSAAIDEVLKNVKKNPQKSLLKIVDMTEKMMGGSSKGFRTAAFAGARDLINQEDSKWMNYVTRLLTETDPHVAKMTALNLGYQAAFKGTKMIRENREKFGCNIPWLILMDPTSACNLRCTRMLGS